MTAVFFIRLFGSLCGLLGDGIISVAFAEYGLDAAGKGFAEIGQSAMQAAGLNYLGASALGTGAVVIGVIWCYLGNNHSRYYW